MTRRAGELRSFLVELAKRGGFMSAPELARLVELDPDREVLIRYHEGREVVLALQAAERIELQERRGWLCRDVSLMVGDPAFEWARESFKAAEPCPHCDGTGVAS